MVTRTTVRWLLVLGMAASAAACADPRRSPGPDPESDTDAKMVMWTDGKEAIQITCGMPGGCQRRARPGTVVMRCS